MKILHVITHLNGGAGKAALRLHEGLLKENIDSHILCKTSVEGVENIQKHESKITIFSRVLRKLKLIEIIEYRDYLRQKNATNFYEWFSFCESDLDITRLEVYKSADIINLHWVATLLDFPSFLKKNKKPVLWSLSDMNSFTGGCHFSNGCNKFIQEKCDLCSQLEGTVDATNSNSNFVIKEQAIKMATFKPIIITPANWLNNLSKSSMLFRNYEHKIIPHPSDESIYKPLNKLKCRAHFNLPKDKIIFLFASGKLSNKRKGFAILIETIKLLDLSNIHFLILGKIDQEIPINTENYTLTGYIQDENELAKAYNAGDSIIIPSFEDNLPLTLIDSMMCGSPAISFNVGGMQSHIIDKFNGYKATEYKSSALLNAIKLFIENISNFNSDEIAKHAFNLYSKEKHCKEMLKIYNNIK